MADNDSTIVENIKNDVKSPKAKWTYLIYMAADSNISDAALYDIVSIQQTKVDSEIDIYVLADRSPAGSDGSGDKETINGTYKWDSDWEDTRVGKITYSPGLTVTVDWESWGELDTGSIDTLERFVNWAQGESPAENYGLILWNHGRENGSFCFDVTTNPGGNASYFTVSEVAGLLKEKGNIPIVIYNACLFASELAVTQMAGSTEVIVVSEPYSYGGSTTYNYPVFFHTITSDMTPREMAAIMVGNVESQKDFPTEPIMLTSVDVTDSRLGDALEALAEAVAAADNDTDKAVLIRAMLQASLDGSNYNGSIVQQSDLGFMIRDVMADPDYGITSEGFRKALADVEAALDAVVLEYRSVPARHGSGIAVCNPVCTAKVLMNKDYTPEAAGARITSYLNSAYDSNPLWGGLLNDLGAMYLAVIPDESDLPDNVTLDNLVGTKDGVSWEPLVLMNNYSVEYSMDGFDHVMQFETRGTAIDQLNLPAGTYQWRVKADSGENPEWFVGEEIVSDNTAAVPNVFRSNSDANDDIFFATPVGTWSNRYCAKHVGFVGDWTGTGEMVSAAGKGRIQDFFFGSADPGSLFLTDSENGDALFLDDIYTGLPEEIEENTARLFRLHEIWGGAGDDIIDMTSQRFGYTGGALLISGGDGDDVIWAGNGKNQLFGDAGNDRIVGSSGSDVIVGGVGNDSMHGGGGDDNFTFCENWGNDTVEQLADGTVTLWFLSGSMENWNAETLTYSDGENSVTVSGVSTDRITLHFEYGGSAVFAALYIMGAFDEFYSEKIFEDADTGLLASV